MTTNYAIKPRINIDTEKQSELDIDDDTIQGQEEFERQRIIKGTIQRLKESRPALFDLFYVNYYNFGADELKEYLPCICASYVLLDVDAVMKFTSFKHPREITNKDLSIAKEMCHFFTSTDQYWDYLVVILDDKLSRKDDIDLVLPFNQEIVAMVNETSIDELQQQIALIETQLKDDLEEHQDFYKQLVRRLRFILATAWHDNFHNELLKQVTKKIPPREVVKVPPDDESMYTKAQRKFRKRVMQQTNGKSMFNKVLNLYFDTRHVVRFENARERLIPQSQIEGLQYWGDEEDTFDDRIDLKYKSTDGLFLPDYEAIVYKGHDWNDYNRQRFDHDKLPPTTIRGYRFRIFYPNLVNQGVAPTHRITKDLLRKDDPIPDPRYQYTVIVFEAGIPYLPIAFRIVDKQFDVYRTNGITCDFHHGVFTFQIVFKASLYFKGYMPEQLY